MGVVMFVNVKCYYNGFGSPPTDYALNIGHVVGFHQRSFKCDDGNEYSYVNAETSSRNQLAIAGTLEELFKTIEEADVKARRLAQPYFPSWYSAPVQPYSG
jgi:hypothetical protein